MKPSTSTILRTENVQRFFKDINNARYNPLEDSIIRKMFADRETFRDLIINAHLRLVVNIAKEYDNSDKMMDYYQEGIEGLMIAFEKYVPTAESKFSSYASYWVRAKMSMLCREFNMVQRSNQGKIGSKAPAGRPEPPGKKGSAQGPRRRPRALLLPPTARGRGKGTRARTRATATTGARHRPPGPARPPRERGTAWPPCDAPRPSPAPRLSPTPRPGPRARARGGEAEEGATPRGREAPPGAPPLLPREPPPRPTEDGGVPSSARGPGPGPRTHRRPPT